jgi:hypothetical protein
MTRLIKNCQDFTDITSESLSVHERAYRELSSFISIQHIKLEFTRVLQCCYPLPTSALVRIFKYYLLQRDRKKLWIKIKTVHEEGLSIPDEEWKNSWIGE